MFSNESLFRLFSVALVGVLFISVSALAEKEKKAMPQTLFSSVQSIEEAEQINNGDLQATNLTTIGNRVEVVNADQTQK
jgi:hypothetical protein